MPLWTKIIILLRNTVVCQQPRKQKKTQGIQVCYLLVYRKVAKFSLLYLQNYYTDFYQIYIFSALHIHKFTYQN